MEYWSVGVLECWSIGMLEYCMKIGHGFNSGIQGLKDLEIEGILSLLIY